eukprot:COSAG06_NODE_627_length_13661_cov_92.900162_6_plen_231_part_00
MCTTAIQFPLHALMLLRICLLPAHIRYCCLLPAACCLLPAACCLLQLLQQQQQQQQQPAAAATRSSSSNPQQQQQQQPASDSVDAGWCIMPVVPDYVVPTSRRDVRQQELVPARSPAQRHRRLSRRRSTDPGGSSASAACPAAARCAQRCRSRLTEPLWQLAPRYRRPPPILGHCRGHAERRARRCGPGSGFYSASGTIAPIYGRHPLKESLNNMHHCPGHHSRFGTTAV